MHVLLNEYANAPLAAVVPGGATPVDDESVSMFWCSKLAGMLAQSPLLGFRMIAFALPLVGLYS